MQDHQIDPFGNKVFRWMVTLETGKEVVTWAASESAALLKAEKRKVRAVSIRPAKNPLEDRPKR